MATNEPSRNTTSSESDCPSTDIEAVVAGPVGDAHFMMLTLLQAAAAGIRDWPSARREELLTALLIDDAEVLGVDGAGLACGDRGRHSGNHAKPRFLVAVFEDVRQMLG
jgi:hypothetical protein